MGPFDTDKWVVCYGSGVVHFTKLPAGSSLVTGQPNHEVFDDEESGLAKAQELGYVKPDRSMPNLEES